MQIKCEHPVIIVNPNIAELLCKYHHYVLAGQHIFYTFNFRGLVQIDLRNIYEFKKRVTSEMLDANVIIDDATGETFPVYIQVPCGHCDVCKETKVNAFVHRCRLETNSYKSRPWFLTLTYDNAHLPDDGVSVREVQLFMKRLRVTLERIGYKERIRYVACGEYGKNTHRAHYHLILWNLCPDKYTDYHEILDCINFAWQYKGFIKHRIVDPKNDRCFHYTAKYMYKDCKVPRGKNPNFLCYSRGNGSIGAPCIDGLKDKLRKHLDTNPYFFDVWKQKAVPLLLSSYILNRVFPSYARSVGSSVRTAVKEFSYYYQVLKDTDPFISEYFEPTYEKLHHFKNAVYFGEMVGRECPFCSLEPSSVYHKLLAHQRTIERAVPKTDLYPTYAEIARLRSVYLGKLSLAPRHYDIAALSHRARRNRLRQQSTQVL